MSNDREKLHKFKVTYTSLSTSEEVEREVSAFDSRDAIEVVNEIFGDDLLDITRVKNIGEDYDE